jgi:hypothetical protein
MNKIFLMMLVVLSFKTTKAQDVPTKESGKKSMLVIDSSNTKVIKTTESKSANKSILNTASKNTSNSNPLVFVQCSGFINKGERCKVKVSPKNGRCFQHQ